MYVYAQGVGVHMRTPICSIVMLSMPVMISAHAVLLAIKHNAGGGHFKQVK